jgi:hypothetical protein
MMMMGITAFNQLLITIITFFMITIRRTEIIASMNIHSFAAIPAYRIDAMMVHFSLSLLIIYVAIEMVMD